MGLTKQQLEALNVSSFPDNTAELITPEILRTYNSASIENTVNQDTYTTDSASFSIRIEAIDDDNVTTASFNAYTQSTNQFTASISTSVGLLQTFSGSQYKADSSSFDSRIDNLEIFSQSADSRYVQNSQTASMAVSSSLYSVTASYAVFAQTASEARNLVVIARNGNQSTLSAGTVVHITGASGDNPIFNTASFDTELLSANTLGIIRTTTTSGADCEVVVNGIVTGVNTDPANGYVAGDVVYLGANGTFTRTQPQAPNQIVVLGQVLRAQQNNGSLYVSINNGWELNELHNVQINTPLTNDILAYESSSYGLWKNKSISQLGLATTGSNSFTGSQIVSGSLTVLGNLTAYTASFITVTSSVVVGGNTILLNTFTPSVRYGGIEVIDSGSTNLTGSLLWDSQNDVWIYVNPTGSAYASARLISGPKSLTLGSEPTLTQNRIPKADDGDHLTDSQISDDGTTVSVTNAFSASTIVGLGNATEFSQSVDSRLDTEEFKSTTFATTGSNTFNGNQTINGVVSISSSATYDLDITGAFQATTNSRVSASTGIATVAPTFLQILSGSTSSNTFGRGYSVYNLDGNQIVIYASGSTGIGGVGTAPIGSSGIAIRSGSVNNAFYYPITFQSALGYTDGRVTISTPLSASAGITSSNAFINGELYSVTSASFDSRINGIVVGTGFATTGSNTFVGNQSITGSLILSSSAATELQVIGAVEITGSVAGNITPLSVTSNTASIDFNLGTFFTLTIPSSSVTYITGSNLKPGMTANIVLTQQSTTGSVRFETSLFKFPSGSINTGSAVASAVDLVSVMSVNTTTLLSVGANRLI